MISLLTSRVGLAGAAILAALLFWEGVPGAREASFVRLVPVAGPVLHDLSLGRVGRAERAGRAAGAADERAAWEEAHRKLREQMDRERREAQAEIDRIERDYLAARTADQLRWHAQLEAAIAANEKENDDADADPTAGPVCSPAIPRGVSRVLNAIGR